MKVSTFRTCKKQLEKTLAQQEECISMEMSATKILNFIINDMLDYAQLSAGQFRKFIKKIDLVDSIESIIKIMSFKANQLDIDIQINLDSLFNKPN